MIRERFSCSYKAPFLPLDLVMFISDMWPSNPHERSQQDCSLTMDKAGTKRISEEQSQDPGVQCVEPVPLMEVMLIICLLIV